MIKQISVLTILIFLFIVPSVDSYAKVIIDEISFKGFDNSNVNAYWVSAKNTKSSPTILLFHQAGASARGEYQDIYPKLVKQGFNVLMVDLRSGGNRFGGVNKTLEQHSNKKLGYCEAYPDMKGSLKWIKTKELSGPIIVWGSSYSAGLVFKLAAENKTIVDGVLGFSPASGKPMEGCRPDEHLKNLSMPAIALRPESEMEYSSVKIQAKKFKALNIPYISIKDGVHGSSMLDEERTKHDMQHAWKEVMIFLNQFKATSPVNITESVSIMVDG
jgi:dienelactone hydrolase